MLRIVVFEEATSVKLRLEGKLTRETTPSLNERWAEVRSRLNDRKAILDLGDVVEIDEASGTRCRVDVALAARVWSEWAQDLAKGTKSMNRFVRKASSGNLSNR